MHHPTDRITHTTAFVTPVVEHWLEREIPQWVRGKSVRSWCNSGNNDDDDISYDDAGCGGGGGGCDGNVLFNDALNTFYLRLYGVGLC